MPLMPNAIDHRFADERELWRAELQRVEALLSTRIGLLETELHRLAARVKYLEERRP